MKSLGKYMVKYWYLYLFAMACLVMGILLDVAAPRVIERIIDDVIVGGNQGILISLLVTLFLLGTGRGVFKYLQEFISDVVGLKISVDIRKKLFTHIEGMSMGFFEKNNTGELMARVKEDVERIWEAVGFVGLLCVEAVVHTAIVIICMVKISPVLTLIPLCIMPMVGYIAIRLEKGLDKVYDDISEENAKLNTVAQENLTGVRTVKAFSRERYEIEKFRKSNGRYYNLNMALAKTMAKYNPNISFLTKTLLVLSVTVGGIFVVQERISLGQLGAFIEYANNIVWPMEILGWVTNSMAAAVASNKKINKILFEEAQIVSPEEPEILTKVRGDLEFRNVSLTLQDQKILEDVSFVLPAGKTLGVMGMTGSGKTTVVNLIERFHDVTEGAILLDGVDVRRLDLSQLRKSTAVVMQDVFLFSDTVGENIRIGSRDWMERPRVEKAAMAADAHGFVSALPEGYDTVIGEKGVGLSGGQKQRLSIARALAKDAPILILDDSTSALDMETEHEIQQQLKEMSGVTKLIIAHRISAVRHADEIIILQDGGIAERGTHESLLAKKGLYYDTYVAQYEEPEEVKEWQ
ncbi:MAG: ABC transporter ATP-binding protein [Lachnospiraceae bacterium]|jgi:ATP-binding cassette subfamily B multidrug efflux pump|nr:ABC transporter ATP-binding protein [Lachnospiraceae bacterium]